MDRLSRCVVGDRECLYRRSAPGQVDTYSASDQAKVVNYTITGLPAGTHTITIEVTGTKGASAQSAWIWVDAFDYQ